MDNPSAITPAGLTLATLTLRKERTYFTWVLLIAILFWLVIAISIVGIFYGAIIGVFLWIGNGLLVAHLRAEAVKIGERQMPELHATFREVCERLGVRTMPALYVLQAGGALNAFATRHTGRDFVVVYSDFLAALGPASPEMKFILGHELGHIQSGHVLKQIFLGPGMLFPLIGPAYRRAWESSCDRYGTFAAQDVAAAARALLVLGGGREHGQRLDASAYASQYREDRGFFVSLHELTSTYPTLSRRVTDTLALKDGVLAAKPERHPLAYLVAIFMPGGGASAAPANALVIVVIVGLLAAMAIPAFQKVRQSSQEKMCFNNSRMLSASLDQYQLENNHGATSWADIVGANKYLKSMPACPTGGSYSASVEKDAGYVVKCSKHGSPTNAPSAKP